MRLEEVLLVVFRPGPEFLVLLRSPERQGYWNLVAGGVEEGEAPTAAARRELDEESGLAQPIRFESLPLELAYVRPEGSKVTMHAFLAEATSGWEPVLNEEHVEYRWCSLADADALLAYPEPRAAVRCVAGLLKLGVA
jgi:dATP pyrophosphohydrolase